MRSMDVNGRGSDRRPHLDFGPDLTRPDLSRPDLT